MAYVSRNDEARMSHKHASAIQTLVRRGGSQLRADYEVRRAMDAERDYRTWLANAKK